MLGFVLGFMLEFVLEFVLGLMLKSEGDKPLIDGWRGQLPAKLGLCNGAQLGAAWGYG